MDLQDQIYVRCLAFHGIEADTETLVQCMTVHHAVDRKLEDLQEDTSSVSFDYARSVLLVMSASLVFFFAGTYANQPEPARTRSRVSHCRFSIRTGWFCHGVCR